MEFIIAVAITVTFFTLIGAAAAAFGVDSRDGFTDETVLPRMSWSEWTSSRRG